MRYLPPKRHRGAIIYLREDPALHGLSPSIQEENCRAYCERKGLPIRTVIRVRCSSADSLEHLHSLLFELPADADFILAARFFCYSTSLRELALLCLQFQCRGAWVYSLEFPGPIHQHLMVLRPSDYDEAEQIREQLDQAHKAALLKQAKHPESK